MTPRLVFCLALAVGCTPALPHAPQSAEGDAAFVAPAEPARPGLADEGAEEDVVCPGDIVAVKTIGAGSISRTDIPVADPRGFDEARAVVDRAGRIHLPLIGDVTVGAAPVAEAERRVQDQMARFDRFARVSLVIVEPRGHYVSVVGAVDHPGNLPLIGDARFADVVAAAGGTKAMQFEGRFVTQGDVEGAKVVRNGKTLPIDARLGMSGDVRHNVRMRAGDLVVVPPANDGRIVVLGHVTKPHTIQYRRGYRLTEALADAGGLTKDGDSDDVRVLRGGMGRPRVYAASLRDVMAGVRPDVQLAPGDVILVTEHWTGTVGALLDRFVPAMAAVFYARAVTR